MSEQEQQGTSRRGAVAKIAEADGGVDIVASNYVVVRSCRHVFLVGCAEVKMEMNDVVETGGNNRFPDGSQR